MVISGFLAAVAIDAATTRTQFSDAVVAKMLDSNKISRRQLSSNLTPPAPARPAAAAAGVAPAGRPAAPTPANNDVLPDLADGRARVRDADGGLVVKSKDYNGYFGGGLPVPPGARTGLSIFASGPPQLARNNDFDYFGAGYVSFISSAQFSCLFS